MAEMRDAGQTWSEIAAHFGVAVATAWRWMNGERPQRREQVRQAVAKVRAVNRAAGLCACGQPRVKQRKSCEGCLTATRERSSKPSAYRAQKAHRQRLRDAALAAYGDKCACCGVTERAFLTIDHVNRDGAVHRQSIGNITINLWLARHGYPDGFQILCWNCNMGRERNDGVCPHEEQRADVRQLRAV